MKISLKYYFIFIMAVSLVILVEYLRPKEVDWRPSYMAGEKIPYGNYVMFRTLHHLFPGQDIELTTDPISVRLGGYVPFDDELFEDIESDVLEDLEEDSMEDEYDLYLDNYLFINTTLPLDEIETNTLLNYVSEGNHVFIAAIDYGMLADTLQIDTEFRTVLFDSITVSFANEALPDTFSIDLDFGVSVFTEVDTLRTAVVGLVDEELPNFIKVSFGQGVFWLHTMPYVFTNYGMLNGPTLQYITTVLSHLPVRPVIWDEYYKTGKRVIATPMRFVLSSTPLRWAYYLALVTVVLFIIFEGRRKRPPIPIIDPPANQTLEFVDTVGRLYFQQGDHKAIGDKRILYFMDRLRTVWNLDTHGIDESGYEMIADKTGVALDHVRDTFACIQSFQSKDVISEDDLITLTSLLDGFPHMGYTQ